MLRNNIRCVICLLVLFSTWPARSISAEFEDSDVLPNITAVGFTQDVVGFVANKSRNSHSLDLAGPASYFMYERSNRKIAEVDAKQFQARFPGGTLRDGPHVDPVTHNLVGYTVNGVPYSLKLKYCGEGVTSDTRKVVIGNRTIQVRAKDECTNVSSVEMVNGQLWLGTEFNGEGGSSKAEGVIVQDMKGARVFARITSFAGWITRMHVDSFTGNVWVITEKGIYEVNPKFKILSANFFYHDFDPSTGQPTLLFSNKETPSNPFAVISRLLPSEDRKNFFEAVAGIPKDDAKKFTLYEFFMCCFLDPPKYPESFQPLTPFFVKSSMEKSSLTCPAIFGPAET